MRLIPLAAVGLLVLGGCATKGDVRALSQEMHWLRQHQDSVLTEIQRQNRLLLDSISTTMALTVDARGTTANQLRQFDRNVTQMGQLVSEVMGTLGRIEQRLAAIEQRGVSSAGPGPTSGGMTADQYYDAGMQKMSEGSFSTARLAFEQLVAEFPDHARAPDAQFQIGESFYRDRAYDDAYVSMERVAEAWATAPRAAAALFRAGVIAEEQRAFPRARRYFTQVRERYPESEEARQAQAKLRSLPGS
ncbi:MAG: outer membrane protein assembly factor BamD [Gemmatimonadetes bacterium]|nr:outer membrane protein assembly factor BamD [Gemmatimonadota bacterium]